MTPTKRHERGNRIALEEKDETCSFEGASSEIIIDKSKQIALYSPSSHLDLEIISFVEFLRKINNICAQKKNYTLQLYSVLILSIQNISFYCWNKASSAISLQPALNDFFWDNCALKSVHLNCCPNKYSVLIPDPILKKSPWTRLSSDWDSVVSSSGFLSLVTLMLPVTISSNYLWAHEH